MICLTKILLVRHAEAEGNVKRIFQGWTNSNLTERGIKQARRLAERLKDEEVDVIYSSDLKRAYDTARFIADYKSLDVFVIKELREIFGGDWEDIPFEELSKKWPQEAYNLDYCLHMLCTPNGESTLQFQKRMVNAINLIIAENQDKNICVVTHGTAIKVLLCYFYQKPIEDIVNIIWGDNTSISIINIDNDEFNVEIENDNSHLDDELSTFADQDWWKK